MGRRIAESVRRALLGLALSLLIGAAAAFAASERDAAVRRDIDRIAAYLNTITTVDSRFVQLSAEGTAQGRILVSRPGDMRVEYDPPVPVLMVASGLWLMYHDSELRQTSFYPVSETPAHFLLRKKIDLNEGLRVTGFVRGGGLLRLTVVDADEPDAGSITLTVADDPMQLVSWRIVDAQGTIVDVSLVNPQFGVPVDPELFSVIDPELGRPQFE